MKLQKKTLFERGVNHVYTVNSDYLIAKSFKRISAFDFNTGRYVNDIGHFGNDPEGYLAAAVSWGVNEKSKTVYALSNRLGVVEYSIENGEIVSEISSPTITNSEEPEFYAVSVPRNFGYLENGDVVGFTANKSGKQKLKLIVFKRTGDILKTYPNHLFFQDNPKTIRSSGTEAEFYNYNSNLYFKERWNDTLYSVSADTLITHGAFDFEGLGLQYSEKDKLSREDWNDFMWVRNINENDNTLFFHLIYRSVTHLCIYDKASDLLRVSDLERGDLNGFFNDIDDFIPFLPNYINEKGELVGIAQAEMIYDWFQSNPDKVSKLPPHLLELRDIQPQDNPVVMIATPK